MLACVQFVGIVLLAIGVLVEIHRGRIESVNNRLALPTALLILVGLLIAINATCGMVGAILEKPLLLKIVSFYKQYLNLLLLYSCDILTRF